MHQLNNQKYASGQEISDHVASSLKMKTNKIN